MASKARGLADLGNVYSDGALSNRNMIINGGMQVDQRNGGAAVVNWPSDRWNTADSPASTTGQTNGGAYTPPAGFSDYLRTITTTANAVLDATDYSVIYQPIEGHNTAQLAWGTSAARDATISFWARSNITGVLGCCVQNFNGTMSYPITYTINVADTWEWKTITVAGPTTGTWNTDNTRGLVLYFGLGVGTTYSGTANVWSTNYYFSATGAADLTGTLNNYLAITGVQLELGDTATPFEHRSYGDELQGCQRYYQVLDTGRLMSIGNGSGLSNGSTDLPVNLRAAATISYVYGNGSNFTGYSGMSGTQIAYTCTLNGSGAGDSQLSYNFNNSNSVYAYWHDLGSASGQVIVNIDAEL